MQKTLLHRLRDTESSETKPFLCTSERRRPETERDFAVELQNTWCEIFWRKRSIRNYLQGDGISWKECYEC